MSSFPAGCGKNVRVEWIKTNTQWLCSLAWKRHNIAIRNSGKHNVPKLFCSSNEVAFLRFGAVRKYLDSGAISVLLALLQYSKKMNIIYYCIHVR